MSRRRRRQLANLGPNGWPLLLTWRPRERVSGIIRAMLALGALPAPARIDGPCELTVEGINVGNVQVTGEDAVVVVPDGAGGRGSFELPAHLLFRYAGGLYEVHACEPLAGRSHHEPAMLVDVDRNPLENPVGKAAAASAVGATGVPGVAAGAAVPGFLMIGDLGTMPTGLPAPTAPSGGKTTGCEHSALEVTHFGANP